VSVRAALLIHTCEELAPTYRNINNRNICRTCPCGHACSMLQPLECCSVMQCVGSGHLLSSTWNICKTRSGITLRALCICFRQWQYTSPTGNTLQRITLHCNTLQHTAIHCNTLSVGTEDLQCSLSVVIVCKWVAEKFVCACLFSVSLPSSGV